MCALGQAGCPQERCDGIDNDADGAVDEDFDADGDGFPDADRCPTVDPVDCDDADPAVYPGAPEPCDGRDGDCDGAADEGSPDADGDGAAACVDCDDADDRRAPGLPETRGAAVDNDCDGATDADLWAAPGGQSPELGKPAFSTLAAAIGAAPDGAVVGVAPGTYLENLVLDGRRLTLAAPAGRDATTVDGRGRGSCVLARGGADVELQGLTLTHGLADLGGALLVEDAAVRLREGALSASTAGESGGGAAVGQAGSLALEDTLVVGCDAYLGGGVAVLGGDLSVTGGRFDANLAYTLLTSEIVTLSDGAHTWTELHTGYGGAGGAVYLGSGATATLEGAVLTANGAVLGGAVYHEGAALTVTGGEISDNLAWAPVATRDASASPSRVVETWYDGKGGGLYLRGSATVEGTSFLGDGAIYGGGIAAEGAAVELAGLSLQEELAYGILQRAARPSGTVDSSTGAGGALWAGPGARVSAVDLVVEAARSPSGGAVHLDGSELVLRRARITAPRADAVLYDDGVTRIQGGSGGAILAANALLDAEGVLITDAVARDVGGAILMQDPLPGTRVASATIVGAGASFGGGILLQGEPAPVSLSGVIVVSGVGGGGIVGIQDGVELRWCDVWGNVGGDLPDGSDPLGEAGNLSADPRFVSRTPGGAPGDDLHLAPDSPCVDAGDPDLADPDGSRADQGAYGGPWAL